MPLSQAGSNGNALRPRRSRPEHVALHVDRIEHLVIEIHRSTPPGGGLDQRLGVVEDVVLHNARDAIVQQLRARSNGAVSTEQ